MPKQGNSYLVEIPGLIMKSLKNAAYTCRILEGNGTNIKNQQNEYKHNFVYVTLNLNIHV